MQNKYFTQMDDCARWLKSRDISAEVYTVRLTWAVSNVGTLTRVEEHQIQKFKRELEFVLV